SLDEHEQQGEADDTPDLEVNPGIGVETVHHHQVDPAEDQEERHPHEVQALPHFGGQLELIADQALDGGAAITDQGSDQERDGKKPVHRRHLPLDPFLVTQKQGNAAEHQHQHRSDEVHGLDGARAHPLHGDLHERGGDDHGGGDKDAVPLVGKKEEQYGEEIEQERHDG